VKGRVGDAPAGPLVTLSGASVRVDTSIDAADAGTVTVGTAVTMRLADLDRRLTGVVTEVADKPGTGGAGASQIAVVITPDDVAAAAELAGAAVVVTVPLATTAGEVLVVPAAAVISALDGATTVKVVGRDGTVRTAAVRTGLSAKGVVEVAPLDGATLGPGDRVVIGERAVPLAAPTAPTTPTTTPPTTGGDRG
jgi:multidrug efflux pump subunit AcrA (membrane-fusion protein)